MKNLFSLILAGIIGGLITLGGFQYFQQNAPQEVDYVPAVAHSVRNINIPAGGSTPPSDFRTAASRSMPAVVNISSVIKSTASNQSDDPFRFFFGDDFNNPFGDGTPGGGTGSGVIYTSDGYIITNNHVVAGANELEVTLFDNRTFKARLIGTDEKSDLAVIKLRAMVFLLLK
jgi:serine protease Do